MFLLKLSSFFPLLQRPGFDQLVLWRDVTLQHLVGGHQVIGQRSEVRERPVAQLAGVVGLRMAQDHVLEVDVAQVDNDREIRVNLYRAFRAVVRQLVFSPAGLNFTGFSFLSLHLCPRFFVQLSFLRNQRRSHCELCLLDPHNAQAHPSTNCTLQVCLLCLL